MISNLLLLLVATTTFAQVPDRNCEENFLRTAGGASLTTEQFRTYLRGTLARLPEVARQVLESRPRTVRLGTEPDAWNRFDGFVREAKGALLERDQLVDTLALTLAIDGSLLVISPKGTGKTLFGRLLYDIKDRVTNAASVFALKLTPETTVSETSGGLIVDGALEGHTERNWAFGVLGFEFVFLDDFFDARLRFLRSFLKQFNERQYVQGGTIVDGKTRVFVATTSRSIAEIYEASKLMMTRASFDPRANIDRFNSIILIPSQFRHTRSLVALARFKEKALSGLFTQDLDQIRADVASIGLTRAQNLRAYLLFDLMHRRMKRLEAESARTLASATRRPRASAPTPFRATRVYSTRTMKLAYKRIAAVAMLRARREGLDEVEVTNDDVDAAMRSYLPLQGPSGEFLDDLLAQAKTDPREYNQLRALQAEQTEFEAALADVKANEAAWSSDTFAQRLTPLWHGEDTDERRGEFAAAVAQLAEKLGRFESTAELTPETLAILGVLSRLDAEMKSAP